MKARRWKNVKPVFASIMPMGHPWIDAIDMSNTPAWLASDEARYVTGIVVPVDQGSSYKIVSCGHRRGSVQSST